MDFEWWNMYNGRFWDTMFLDFPLYIRQSWKFNDIEYTGVR